jgi:hypothetical protein
MNGDMAVGAMLFAEAIFVSSMAFYIPAKWARKAGNGKLSSWFMGMFYICSGAGIGISLKIDLVGGLVALFCFGGIDALAVYLDRRLAWWEGRAAGQKAEMRKTDDFLGQMVAKGKLGK